MSAEWADYWTYEWIRDIGLPALGAIGTIAVGAGAIWVAVSSNRVATGIANRDHALQTKRDEADELDARVEFGALVTRWSDRIIAEILRPTMAITMLGAKDPIEPSEELKAEVDARAAAFRHQNGQDLVAAVESLTAGTPDGRAPSDNKTRETIVDVRRAYVQSWIAHPLTWKELDSGARLTAKGWTMAAQFRGRFEADNEYIDPPSA